MQDCEGFLFIVWPKLCAPTGGRRWRTGRAFPALCPRCGGEIYPAETRYLWRGRLLCADCLEACLAALSTGEKAALMGVRTVEAREKPGGKQ